VKWRTSVVLHFHKELLLSRVRWRTFCSVTIIIKGQQLNQVSLLIDVRPALTVADFELTVRHLHLTIRQPYIPHMPCLSCIRTLPSFVHVVVSYDFCVYYINVLCLWCFIFDIVTIS
jgi:hypothetical protein